MKICYQKLITAIRDYPVDNIFCMKIEKKGFKRDIEFW